MTITEKTAARSPATGSRRGRRFRRRASVLRSVALVVAASLIAACAPATPSPTPSPSASPTVTPRPTRAVATLPAATTFSFAVGNEPTTFAPGSPDPGARLIARFISNALYRLDDRLLVRPDLAEAPPFVGDDGESWSVPLRSGVRFHDGTRLVPDDVVFSYRLALSPDCPFAELCGIARAGLVAVSEDAGDVRFELREPNSALLATLLAQLPIVPQDVVEASRDRFLEGARRVGAPAVASLTEEVDTATNADACLREAPPADCALAAHIEPLEAMLRSAGVSLPPRAAFPDGAGSLDLEAYAATLLRRVQLLGSALAGEGIDQIAAAYPLLDFGLRPVGTGKFRFARYQPGDSVELIRFEGAFGGPASVAAVRARIIDDPRIAATALKTGEIDWLPEIGTEQVSELAAEPTLRIGGQPGPALRLIVFNVRPGRVYADPAARRAFAQCLDRERAAQIATGGRADAAWATTTPGTWAYPTSLTPTPGDPEAAKRTLADAGWALGGDGIHVLAGRRLSSEMFIRTSRGDQLDFATSARDQLAACGIELVVRELDLSGGALLDQLQWPNDFDTVFLSRELGADPDVDLSPYESRHVTTAENPGDTGIGGWSDPRMDAVLGEARRSADVTTRTQLYREAQAILARDVPVLPLWYQRTYAGLSARVAGAERTIDLTSADYAWDVDTWQLINQ